jgi:hypothetical protein
MKMLWAEEKATRVMRMDEGRRRGMVSGKMLFRVEYRSPAEGRKTMVNQAGEKFSKPSLYCRTVSLPLQPCLCLAT